MILWFLSDRISLGNYAKHSQHIATIRASKLKIAPEIAHRLQNNEPAAARFNYIFPFKTIKGTNHIGRRNIPSISAATTARVLKKTTHFPADTLSLNANNNITILSPDNPSRNRRKRLRKPTYVFFSLENLPINLQHFYNIQEFQIVDFTLRRRVSTTHSRKVYG